MAKMFMTLNETKAHLGQNEAGIKRLVRAGLLREFRDGPRMMFKTDQVEDVRGQLSDSGSEASVAASEQSAGMEETAAAQPQQDETPIKKNPFLENLRMHVEPLIIVINKILDGGVVNPFEFKRVLYTAYDYVTAEYRPLLELLTNFVSDKLPGELKPIILMLMKFKQVNLVDKDIIRLAEELATTYAQQRKRAFDAYTKAGFSPDQAMQLLLSDIARTPTVMSSMSQGMAVANMVKETVKGSAKKKA